MKELEDFSKRLQHYGRVVTTTMELATQIANMLKPIMEKYPHVFTECVLREDFEKYEYLRKLLLSQIDGLKRKGENDG